MPTIDEMSLDEVEATLAKLRARRQVLRKTGKVAERKIVTLERRKQRLMSRVREIDDQIETLRHEATAEQPVIKRRGRRSKAEIAAAAAQGK
jgi:chromosome segregation ATPase